MANENLITPAPVTTPVPVSVEAVVAAPAVTPVVAAPVPTPVEPAPAPAVEAVKPPETLLGQESKPAEKPVETPKPVTAEVTQKTPEGQSEEPAPPPVYEAFKVPEGVTLDTERVSKFSGILGEFESKGKWDHKLVQEFGQKAVDFHVEEVQKATTALNDLYKQSWERQKTEWKDSFLKDPEIGGTRFQTTVDSALTFIRTHGGTPEQQTEFRNLMETSGLGNHPAMIRLLAKAQTAMAEGQPLAAQKPVPPPKSKVSTLYGTMGQ